MEPTSNTPKSRTNLREVLISSFESDAGLPSEQRARRSRQAQQRSPIRRFIPSVRVGGAESFFVGVFAGMAGGLAAGYFGTVMVEAARKSVNQTITWLVPGAVPSSMYIFAAFLGAIIGMYLGFTMLAPWLERRKKYKGTHYEGRLS